jgi:hypothetical protein
MVTISVRADVSQMNGVAQPDFCRPDSSAFRLVVQATLPVFASSAVRNDSPSLSRWM